VLGGIGLSLNIYLGRAVLGALFALAVMPAAEALDAASLYTTYALSPDKNTITWTTCGNAGPDSGCYGRGTFRPLTNPCAVMAGPTSVSGNTVSQTVYVVEGGSASHRHAMLDIFAKQDVVSGADKPSSKLVSQVDLGVRVGPNSVCFMAGGPRYLYVGTPLSTYAARFDTTTGKVSAQSADSDIPEPVSQITVDDRGYVSITWGTSPSTNSIVTLSPRGGAVGFGGGSGFFLNQNAPLLVK
jgi:hypothetical protein